MNKLAVQYEVQGTLVEVLVVTDKTADEVVELFASRWGHAVTSVKATKRKGRAQQI
jgi:hypothetical protein